MEFLEEMASAAHQVWVDGKIRDGWKWGSITNKDNKIHNCLIPYEELSDSDKESDRDFVRSIPKILEIAGFIIIKK